MELIKCYTDGSAVVSGQNAGKAGFGVYFPDLFGKPRAFSMGFMNGKTGQMEVCALLFAIRAIPLEYHSDMVLQVFSDSEYVVKSFTENRLQKWILQGWRNTSGEVANVELWKMIVESLRLRRSLTLEMVHIKSHTLEKTRDPETKKLLLMNPDVIGNAMADKFADYKRHKNLLGSVSDIKHRESIY